LTAIEIKNLTKRYKDFTLDNINLTLPTGCVMGLIGENGAGKTTTIKLITGLTSPDKGDITVLGQNNARDFSKIKEDLGVVLDEAYFPEAINANQVNSILKNTYKNWDEKAYFRYIEKFSLPPKKAFKDFSRGMKMKLSIAVALSHNAKLLILDEPTSGLDPLVRDEILDIFFDFIKEENHSILISSHIVSDLEKLCDYIAFLHKGKMLICEEKDRLLENYGILKCRKEDLINIRKEAIKGCRNGEYGTEALVLREAVPAGFRLDRASIEDIFLYSVKSTKGA
jgi:ABC-2 type transport system ATP-binding protein